MHLHVIQEVSALTFRGNSGARRTAAVFSGWVAGWVDCTHSVHLLWGCHFGATQSSTQHGINLTTAPKLVFTYYSAKNGLGAHLKSEAQNLDF